MKKHLQTILSLLCVLALALGTFTALAEGNVSKVITVKWSDGDNYDQLRPAQIKANLAGQEVVLNEANGWTGEVSVPEGTDPSGWEYDDVNGYAASLTPGDISELGIVPGQDYCTLVTCTPYGINTHRMLVRGHRVANESGDLVVTPEAYRIPNYLTIPAVAIPLLFLFLIGMLIYYRISNARMKKNDVYRLIEEVTEERPSSDTGKKKAGRRRKE